MRDFDIIHRVEKNDTIMSISTKYKVPSSVIIFDNNIKEEIYEGQRLVISNISGTVYKVKPSDSIDIISKKFSISKEKILSDNKINMVFPFMDIIINKAK